jgi:hypothetical protein
LSEGQDNFHKAKSTVILLLVVSIDREGVTIFDATVPGFRLNPDTASEMAEEVKNLVTD